MIQFNNQFSSRHEKIIILTLAAALFTAIIDFIIIMPLGPQLMRVFDISPQKFSLIVATYTLSASLSGLFSSFFIDRFDRKHAIVFIFTGFIIGTLLCGLAPTANFLILARMITGLFGGILGAQCQVIIGDIIPYERRSAAMGLLSTSFSLSNIVGVPLGLFLGNTWNWRAPFYFLVVLSAIVLIGVVKYIPSLKSHLGADNKNKTWINFKGLVSGVNELRALGLSLTMMMGHFVVIPFLSPSMVSNVGFQENQLYLIYLLGGLATIITSQLIGKIADRRGNHKVFIISSILCVPIIWILTRLTITPLPLALFYTTLFFIFSNARMVPAMTMISSTVVPHKRGGFMSLSSSVQNFSTAMATIVAGLIVSRSASGGLEHYERTSYISLVVMLIAVTLAAKLRKSQ